MARLGRARSTTKAGLTMTTLATGLSADAIAALFEVSPDYFLVLDPEGRLLAANEAFRHGALEDPAQVPDRLADALVPADAEPLKAALARIGAAGSVTLDLRHPGPTGRAATVAYTFFPSPQAPDAILAVGRPRGGSATLDDRLRSMQARLSQMHGRVERLRDQLAEEVAGDDLRSLPTRWEFEQILEREWARAARLGLGLSLLAIDVDGLRHVNSRFGQREGDRVLREVAARLLRQTRSYDAVARVDGDRFLLVTVRLPSDEQSAAAFARRIQRLASDEPIDLGEGRQARITVSIGVASAALSTETPLAPEGLQKAARDALSQAKAAGGNEVRLTTALPTPA